jgi:hypothetical protein
MSKHVNHLITAYIHRQLPSRQRNRVLKHVNDCPECWDALAHEQEIQRDIANVMRTLGQPSKRQLDRLWPSIWSEFIAPRRSRRLVTIPTYGLALGMFMLVAFVAMLLMTGPTQVIAAPFQAAPLRITATATAATTDEPSATTKASQTANPYVLPMPSPAPVVGSVLSSVHYTGGK